MVFTPLPPLLLPGSAFLPSACSPVSDLSSLSLTAQRSVLGKYMVLSCATPPDFLQVSLSQPFLPDLGQGLGFDGQVSSCPHDRFPSTLTVPISCLQTSPSYLLAPSFPFRSFLSKVVPSFVCGFSRVHLWWTDSLLRHAFTRGCPCRSMAFPLTCVSFMALLLSLDFVSWTLLAMLVLQEQILYVFPLLTEH